MRMSVKNDGKTCFDCPQADQSTKGQMSIHCNRKGISVYASNTTYHRCQCEQARARLAKEQ